MKANELMELKSDPQTNMYLMELLKIKHIYDSIEDIDGLINTFLKGLGLSEHTLLAYKTAIRTFFHFVNNKNPRLITIADVENFFDFLRSARFCNGRRDNIPECKNCREPKKVLEIMK